VTTPAAQATDARARVFSALGDPTRVLLVAELARRGTAPEHALAAPLPMSRQAVGKHLAVLRDAGLVVADRRGRETRYRLRTEALTEAQRWLDDVATEWERQLLLVKDAVEAARPRS
jgi:DNA-binding transcriptional ArsR family regulator